MFDKTNFDYFSCDIWVFNKTNLYAGGAGQFTFFRYLQASLGEASVLVPAVNYDSAYPTNFLVSNFDGNFPDTGLGYLRLFAIGGPVGSETFEDYGGPGGTNGVFAIFFNPWESYVPGFGNFAPQKGTTNKVYIGDARIQNLVFRDGFLWLSQHVFVPASNPNRVSVQWAELTPGGFTIQGGFLDDPSAFKSYAYPSLAVNNNEDLLLGFSTFSSSQYPSAGYAFHSFEDGNGALRLDGVLKAGETNFFLNNRGLNRWGDWSATMVDPVNDLDMWTIQEYAAAHTNGTNHWGTWWGRVSPLTDLALSSTSDAPDPVIVGATVTYSINVTNVLNVIGTGVRIVDTLPTGAAFVSATASQGACAQTNGIVTCNFGDVLDGAVVTASIVSRLNQSGTDTNVVTASAFGSDENPADNSVKLLTTVNPAADLTVLLASSADP